MDTKGDRGFTLVELLLVVTIISILGGMAVPVLLRARMVGNETTAIGSLRVTSTSQISFSATCGNGGYAPGYIILGTPIGGSGQAFISDDLGRSATPQKAGFNYNMTRGTSGAGPNDCMGRPTVAGYYATAQPMGFGSTGSRAFAVAIGGAVWQHIGPTPPVQPFVAGAWDFPIQ
jgi:prepilin-type N-terminal cleavage/methylation domain-containing protein